MNNDLEKARAEIDRIDKAMAELFEERMKAAQKICAYKKEKGLPVSDPQREKKVIERNCALIKDDAVRDYYDSFIKNLMSLSRRYQHSMLSSSESVTIRLFSEGSYDITVGRGLLESAGLLFDLDRRVLIVTDSGIPAEYVKALREQCSKPFVFTAEQGETLKNIQNFEKLLTLMLENNFSRRDCVVALGGGTVGDLAGFAASAYMRGIDFYNIPTTLLSQIDSSIGGKTAINLGGVKNPVGAFYQPKGVLTDPDLLATLPPRQLSNGLAEAIKMSLTSDPGLFDIFENGSVESSIDEIILRSLSIKKSVVEQDERESGVRKILNFGHTIGHAIESTDNSGLYHGECVALGLIPMCSEDIRDRVIAVLKKCGLYNLPVLDFDKIGKAILHDKKGDGGSVTVTLVSSIGSYEFRTVSTDEIVARAKSCLKG